MVLLTGRVFVGPTLGLACACCCVRIPRGIKKAFTTRRAFAAASGSHHRRLHRNVCSVSASRASDRCIYCTGNNGEFGAFRKIISSGIVWVVLSRITCTSFAAILWWISDASRSYGAYGSDSSHRRFCSCAGGNMFELGRKIDLDRRAVQRNQDVVGRDVLDVPSVVLA